MKIYVGLCGVCGGVQAASVDDGSPESKASLSDWVERGLTVRMQDGPVAISCTCSGQLKPSVTVIAE